MPPSFILLWAQAIAQVEGFNTSGSRSARNHNPGDLKYAGQAGATGKDSGGFAVFPDDSTGWQALYNQLQAYVNEYPDYSISQIMAHYLGQGSTPTVDAQGNAISYANTVASAIGVPVTTTLAQLAGGTDSSAPAVEDASSGNSGGGDGWNPSTGELIAIAAAGSVFLLAALHFGSG